MQKKTFNYSVTILVIYSVISYFIVVSEHYNAEEIYALIVAAFLAFLNLQFAVYFIRRNLLKSDRQFLKGFLISTIVRFVILIAIFFTIVLNMPLNHFVFGAGFFILYFLFQIIEIYILHVNKGLGK